MSQRESQEEVAAARMEIIAPLVAKGIDSGQAKYLRDKICNQTGLSERTIRRYVKAYNEAGFEGLKPKLKGRSGTSIIPDDILEEAIYLRREVPSRSISQIIKVLEMEKRIQPGEIKRSTLQEQLSRRGFSSRHIRLYNDPGVASRRYQHAHRNELWHSDIKYGPYLPIGPNGKKEQVYLVVFLDDATRYMIHGMFYRTLDQTIVQEGFRRSISEYGVPERVYFDNGKQYKTKWMSRACAKLGTRLLYAKPYSPESKGKVERFNRNVDVFLQEIQLNPPKSLEQLNRQFYFWAKQWYQESSHSALPDGETPQSVFQKDSEPIRYIDPEELSRAFLHTESRKVDKSGCINFRGEKYEVGLSFIGEQVDVVFDPCDISELTIEYKDHQPWQATKLVIGKTTGKRPEMPRGIDRVTSDRSRVLDAAEKVELEKDRIQKPVISYKAVERRSR